MTHPARRRNDDRQTPGDRLLKLARSEQYLLAAEQGTVPEIETRNWVMFGNAALKEGEME